MKALFHKDLNNSASYGWLVFYCLPLSIIIASRVLPDVRSSADNLDRYRPFMEETTNRCFLHIQVHFLPGGYTNLWVASWCGIKSHFDTINKKNKLATGLSEIGRIWCIWDKMHSTDLRINSSQAEIYATVDGVQLFVLEFHFLRMAKMTHLEGTEILVHTSGLVTQTLPVMQDITICAMVFFLN